MGFVGGLLAVLGGVWTAYRLLGHAVYRELDQQRERIATLETGAGTQAQNVNDRLTREMEQRHQEEKAALDARLRLGNRITILETDFRRWRESGRGE
ncbi:MAG: hypothetical protein OXG39_11010 [Chloroflexi bacterium]|nr:hypothetical protein [Chloroflexota bacterium]